eukprot:1343464-Pleurochrysis_carterae.AAC.3
MSSMSAATRARASPDVAWIGLQSCTRLSAMRLLPIAHTTPSRLGLGVAQPPNALVAVLAAALVFSADAPVGAAQLGAEDAYKIEAFDDRPCARRTLLGACAKQDNQEVAPTPTPGARVAPAGAGGQKSSSAAAEPESDLIRTLRARSQENAEANARAVRDRTLANGMSGTFGPFATTAPIMKSDGSFVAVPLLKLEALKSQGKVVTAPSGLDVFVDSNDTEVDEKGADYCSTSLLFHQAVIDFSSKASRRMVGWWAWCRMVSLMICQSVWLGQWATCPMSMLLPVAHEVRLVLVFTNVVELNSDAEGIPRLSLL